MGTISDLFIRVLALLTLIAIALGFFTKSNKVGGILSIILCFILSWGVITGQVTGDLGVHISIYFIVITAILGLILLIFG